MDIKNNSKLIEFFKDKNFIFALIAAVIATYFYLDHKRYMFFDPILNEFLEFVITPIIWVIYKLMTKKTFAYNYKEIFKFSIIYSIFMTLVSVTLDFTIYYSSPRNNLSYLSSGIFFLTLGRTIIIYIWITFINVICQMITNSIKFIFKK